MKPTRTPVTSSDEESSHVQLALLNHRLAEVEKSIDDLYQHKNSNVRKLSYVSGVVSVLSIIGTALFGFLYDKYIK